jgi:DNA-binding IscR family transcriptional regulator
MPVLPAAGPMDQKIFSLGLPVETVSAYLLCCALAEDGGPVTRPDLLAVWNATPEALDKALAELVNHNILTPVEAAGGHRLLPPENWRPN